MAITRGAKVPWARNGHGELHDRKRARGDMVGTSVRSSHSSSYKGIGIVLAGAAVGIAASWVKALSEPRLQGLFERLVQPTEREKELVGADPSGHPERMPPAEVADRLVRRAGRSALSRQQRISVLNPVHYSLGAALGVAYFGAARRWPAVTRGLGLPAGLAIYGSTHGSALPIIRIQEPPWKLPASAVLWEGTSHLVFGLALEVFRRAAASAVPAGS